MHVAAANGYLDVMEFLLDNGALVDVQDRDGWQPIHAAVCWGQVKHIVSIVCDPRALDRLYQTSWIAPISLTNSLS